MQLFHKKLIGKNIATVKNEITRAAINANVEKKLKEQNKRREKDCSKIMEEREREG
jgi:hypothetical protein